jgi:hypothetical protein
MDPLYDSPATANPLFWLAVYLVLAVVLSYHWIWQEKRDSVFWKMTEFFWLASAVIGLVAAASQIRQSNAEFREPAAQNSVILAFVRLQTEVRTEASRVCDVAPRAGQSESEAGREAQQACQWFQEVDRLLTILPPVDPSEPLNVYFPGPVPKLIVPAYATAVSSVNSQIEGLRMARAARVKARKEARRGPLEFIFGPIGALLLALGLAIRTAKAVAEYRAEKQKQANPASAKTEGAGQDDNARDESLTIAGPHDKPAQIAAPRVGDVSASRTSNTPLQTLKPLPVRPEDQA